MNGTQPHEDGSNGTGPIGDEDGAPTLFGVLGLEIHLEPIENRDQDALAAVNELVWDWIGPELKQTWFSFYEGPVKTDRSDLDYVSCFARNLAKPVIPGAPPQVQIVAADLVRFARSTYSVMCNGGAEAAHASPFSYRFWSETPRVGQDPKCYRPFAALNVTVPDTWPLQDFAERVRAIVRALRVRWAVAGLSYSDWELVDPWPARDQTFRHARRYLGYDVGYFVRFLEEWQQQIRSVSWMTFLGPAFLAKLVALGQPALQSSGLVRVEQVGTTTLLVAGDAPQPGDRNALQVPPAYQEADAMLRRIRADENVNFQQPWDETTTREWLRRFELRYS